MTMSAFISLYETRDVYYFTAFDNKLNLVRVIELARPAFPGEYDDFQLKIDHHCYTKSALQQKMKNALLISANIWAIFGFIRLPTSQNIVLVTDAEHVASIQGHCVYRLKDVVYLPVSYRRRNTVNESRYQRVLRSLDLTKGFYFSFSYDMTSSMQEIHTTLTCSTCANKPNNNLFYSFPTVNDHFIWNMHALEPLMRLLYNHNNQQHNAQVNSTSFPTNSSSNSFEPIETKRWIIPIIHGFILQKLIHMQGDSVTNYTLIARRSRHFAGTRYLRRGVNVHGHVANEVEIEQIVTVDNSASPGAASSGTRSCSLVQLRGSIPLPWCNINIMVPQPDIIMDMLSSTKESENDYINNAHVPSYYQWSQRHFHDCCYRYRDGPLYILDLMRWVGSNREMFLGSEFRKLCKFMNSNSYCVVSNRVPGQEFISPINISDNGNMSIVPDICVSGSNMNSNINFHDNPPTKDTMGDKNNNGNENYSDDDDGSDRNDDNNIKHTMSHHIISTPQITYIAMDILSGMRESKQRQQSPIIQQSTTTNQLSTDSKNQSKTMIGMKDLNNCSDHSSFIPKDNVVNPTNDHQQGTQNNVNANTHDYIEHDDISNLNKKDDSSINKNDDNNNNDQNDAPVSSNLHPTNPCNNVCADTATNMDAKGTSGGEIFAALAAITEFVFPETGFYVQPPINSLHALYSDSATTSSSMKNTHYTVSEIESNSAEANRSSRNSNDSIPTKDKKIDAALSLPEYVSFPLSQSLHDKYWNKNQTALSDDVNQDDNYKKNENTTHNSLEESGSKSGSNSQKDDHRQSSSTDIPGIDKGIYPFGLLQRGVLRTNCVDCLDRTNLAQLSYALQVIERQFQVLGINLSSESLIKVQQDALQAWTELGNVISQQYGGSDALHRVILVSPTQNIPPSQTPRTNNDNQTNNSFAASVFPTTTTKETDTTTNNYAKNITKINNHNDYRKSAESVLFPSRPYGGLLLQNEVAILPPTMIVEDATNEENIIIQKYSPPTTAFSSRINSSDCGNTNSTASCNTINMTTTSTSVTAFSAVATTVTPITPRSTTASFSFTQGIQNAFSAVRRYYSNVTTDFDRQHSIDLILGIYRPKGGDSIIYRIGNNGGCNKIKDSDSKTSSIIDTRNVESNGDSAITNHVNAIGVAPFHLLSQYSPYYPSNQRKNSNFTSNPPTNPSNQPTTGITVLPSISTPSSASTSSTTSDTIAEPTMKPIWDIESTPTLTRQFPSVPNIYFNQRRSISLSNQQQLNSKIPVIVPSNTDVDEMRIINESFHEHSVCDHCGQRPAAYISTKCAYIQNNPSALSISTTSANLTVSASFATNNSHNTLPIPNQSAQKPKRILVAIPCEDEDGKESPPVSHSKSFSQDKNIHENMESARQNNSNLYSTQAFILPPTTSNSNLTMPLTTNNIKVSLTTTNTDSSITNNNIDKEMNNAESPASKGNAQQSTPENCVLQ